MVYSVTHPYLPTLPSCYHRYGNTEVVLKYARWALERDERTAVGIFTDRNPQDQVSKELRTDRVLDFLSPFPTATVIFLEHLVHDKESKVSC